MKLVDMHNSLILGVLTELIMTDYSGILDGIPDYREYLTLDQLNANSEALAKNYPDVVKLLELGKSTKGEPIKCLKIGEGKYHALVYGFPNPEEPLGGLLLDYLSHALAENRASLRDLNYTWYLIKCIDPDGARLAEGFLKGPFTPLHFAENYYRTPTCLAGEMNFPFRHGNLDFNNPVAETKALMKILDEASFDFISSLHNMKWGGITYQVSEPCPSLYSPLLQLAKTHNVFPRKRLGTILAPGVQFASYPAGYFTPVRNYAKAKAAGIAPLPDIKGTFTFEYALLSNQHLFMLVPECCLWYDPRCWDDSPSDATVADMLKYSGQVGSESSKFTLSLYEKAEPALRAPSPFLEMIRNLIDELRTTKVNVLDPNPKLSERDLKRTASVAEKIETEGRADVYRLFNLGAMIRMLDHQLASKGSGDTVLKSCRNEAVSRLEEYDKDVKKKYDCKAFPIRNLIGMNLGSILYSAEYVKWKGWDRSRLPAVSIESRPLVI
jgi:hypothetical protein